MDILYFEEQNDFWNWLFEHKDDPKGYWLKFDKMKMDSKLTSEEALDVALSFGWIDGQIKKIDERFYIKYFTRRREKSIWSTKNKKAIERLSQNNLMMPSGLYEVNRAKQDGRWDQADKVPEDFDIDNFQKLLIDYPMALSNFLAFSPSIRKTYAMSYYTLKKQESRDKRLKMIIERLEKKLKPME